MVTIDSIVTSVQNAAMDALAPVKMLADGAAMAAKSSCDELLKDYDETKQGLVQPFYAAIDTAIDALSNQLDALIGMTVDTITAKLNQTLAEARRRLEPLANQLVENAVQAARQDVAPVIAKVDQTVNSGFQLLRAFGEVPAIPQLDFNCKNIGYYFANSGAVDITPITSLVNRVGDGLKAMGMTLPTTNLLNNVVPNLSNLNLNSVLRQLGGLDLSKLIPNAPITSKSSPFIHVEQGLNPQTRRGWLKTYVKDMPVPEGDPGDDTRQTGIFDFGFVKVELSKGFANALSSVTSDGRSVDKSFSASLKGDWNLNIGDIDIVTFTDTTLAMTRVGICTSISRRTRSS